MQTHVAVHVFCLEMNAKRNDAFKGCFLSAMGSIIFAQSGIFIGRPPPEHFIEQLREPKNRRDGETGDPPESKTYLWVRFQFYGRSLETVVISICCSTPI